MPSGSAGVRNTMAGAQKGYVRRDGPPQFFLRDREFAIVRLLATGADEDPHFGAGQVHVNKRDGQDWQACPTGYDDPEGKCRCEDLDRSIWNVSYRFGIHMFLLRHFCVDQPKDQQGNVRDYAKSWEQISISDQMRSMVRQLDKYGKDPDNGLRYVSRPESYRIWFRGVGYNNQFIEDIEQLRTFMPGGNLSSRNVLIAKKPSVPGKEIPQPVWIIREAPEGIAECNVELDDALRAEITKWYQALPPVGDYFKGEFKWPLFDEEKDTEKVPAAVEDEPVYEAAPEPDFTVDGPDGPDDQPLAVEPTPIRAEAPIAEPRESPIPENHPVPADIQSEGLRSFLGDE